MNFILAHFFGKHKRIKIFELPTKMSVKFGNLHLWQTWQFGWIAEHSKHVHSNYKFLSSIRGLYLAFTNLP
jgi:hypothetical protein